MLALRNTIVTDLALEYLRRLKKREILNLADTEVQCGGCHGSPASVAKLWDSTIAITTPSSVVPKSFVSFDSPAVRLGRDDRGSVLCPRAAFRPHHAAVAVQHRGYWFYVDETDLDSKSTFNLLLELFNLEIRAGGGAQIPLLTI